MQSGDTVPRRHAKPVPTDVGGRRRGDGVDFDSAGWPPGVVAPAASASETPREGGRVPRRRDGGVI